MLEELGSELDKLVELLVEQVHKIEGEGIHVPHWSPQSVRGLHHISQSELIEALCVIRVLSSVVYGAQDYTSPENPKEADVSTNSCETKEHVSIQSYEPGQLLLL